MRMLGMYIFGITFAFLVATQTANYVKIAVMNAAHNITIAGK